MLEVTEAMSKIIDSRLDNNWTRYGWQRNGGIDVVGGEWVGIGWGIGGKSGVKNVWHSG